MDRLNATLRPVHGELKEASQPEDELDRNLKGFGELINLKAGAGIFERQDTPIYCSVTVVALNLHHYIVSVGYPSDCASYLHLKQLQKSQKGN